MLRKRGQRPEGSVFLAELFEHRRNLSRRGIYALGLPPEECAIRIAGLCVVMVANRTERAIKAAGEILEARPKSFQIKWLGEKWEEVL